MQRREFLTGGLALAGLGLLGGCGSSATGTLSGSGAGPSTVGFPQPPVLRSQNGVLKATFQVVMAQNQVAGRTINTATYNGQIPGPTLRLRGGDRLELLIQNQLPPNTDPMPPDVNVPHSPNTTNIHTHGFHVSPMTPSDNVLTVIEPGASFAYTYQIPVNHPVGTYFYHPHNHGSVAVQMWAGMSGAIIIEGDLDEVQGVREATDLVMLIQEIRVNSDGIVPPFANQSNIIPNLPPIHLINGVQNPTLVVRTGEVVRWRLINACVVDFMKVQLEGHTMQVLAYDGNTLPAPQTADSILIPNASRADVLVRAGKPGTYRLMRDYYDQGFAYDPGFGPPGEVLATIQVVDGAGTGPAFPTTLPQPLNQQTDIADSEIVLRRQITFESPSPNLLWPIGQFEINGVKFNSNRVDQVMTLGTAEEWVLYNTDDEDHPFHIHINPFQVVAINGQPQAQRIWRDTVIVPTGGNVTIRQRFLDFTGIYVFHCHILFHECVGMMQLVEVAPPGLSQVEMLRRSRHVQRLQAGLQRQFAELDEFCRPKRVRRVRWGPPSV